MSYVNVQERRLPFILRYIGDLIAYRHLLWNLVASDLRSRFRRTRLGILWALVQPLAFATIIALVWGGIRATGTYWEFALYVFSGVVVFDMFSTTVNIGQDGLLRAGGYLQQARIPFLIFQARTVLSASVVFSIAILGVLVFAVSIGHLPAIGPHLVLIPAFFAIYLFFLIPLSILMSLIGCYYRDLKHISGLAMQALFMVSPIFMPRDALNSPTLQFMQYLNPVVPLFDMFRDPVLYGRFWEAQDVLVVGIWSVGLWAAAITASISVGRRPVFAL